MIEKLIDLAPDMPLSEHDSLTADVEMWVERYLESRLHLSKRTHKSYADALLPFVRFCEQYDKTMKIHEIGGLFINHYIVYYIKWLADYHFGLKTIRGRSGAIRDSPTSISDEEYHQIRNNFGVRFKRDYSNIILPRRFEGTVLQRLTVLKQLLKYISENNEQQHDFRPSFSRIAKFKIHDSKADFLYVSELEKLRETLQKWPEIFRDHVKGISDAARMRKTMKASAYVAMRNAFIMLVLSYTGMRAGEALSLRTSSFKKASFDGRQFFDISIVGGKGDKDRSVPVPVDVLGPLYETMVGYIGPDAPIASITPGETKGISYAGLFRYSRYIYDAAGIEKSGFHMIRKGFATEYIAKGGDIETLAKILGHENVQTTHVHYVKNNVELLMMRSVH